MEISGHKLIALAVLLAMAVLASYSMINFLIEYAEFRYEYDSMDESCIPGPSVSFILSQSLGERVFNVDFQKEKHFRCMELKLAEANSYLLTYNSSSECENAPKKILCSFLMANRTGDAADCNGYDYCVYRIAIKTMNLTLCRNISTADGIDFCFYKFALRVQNPDICDMIRSEGGYDCRFHCGSLLKNAEKLLMPVEIIDQTDTCNRLEDGLANGEVFV